MGTLRPIVRRLSRSWRWLPALLAVVALILPSLGGSGLPSAAHADSTPMASAHATHLASAAHTVDALDATHPTDDLFSVCADGLCALCVALASRPVPAVTEPAPPAWPAPRPTPAAGRLVAPETPPPIA